MRKLLYILALLILILTYHTAYSQNPQWIVYTTQNSGLPVNTISALTYESNGVMWIGAAGAGLVKFDGTNWIVYDTSNSPLPNNNIPCQTELRFLLNHYSVIVHQHDFHLQDHHLLVGYEVGNQLSQKCERLRRYNHNYKHPKNH